MPRLRVLRSVVHSYLGAIASRCSDYRGYYLFGFLTDEPGVMRFDLLGEVGGTAPEDHPISALKHRAITLFQLLLAKHGLRPDCLRRATLEVHPTKEQSRAWMGNKIRDGYWTTFSAVLETVGGKIYSGSRTFLVAPHDPKVELRSAR